MFISKKKFKELQNYVEVLQKDVMRTRSWHECNNCETIFKRNILILSKYEFDYCEICRPKMKEIDKLKIWVKNNKKEVLTLKERLDKED